MVPVLTLLVLLLEVFTYKNILLKHFYISSDVLFVISLFFVWAILNIRDFGITTIDKITLYVIRFIKYLFIPFFVVYVYFIFLNILLV